MPDYRTRVRNFDINERRRITNYRVLKSQGHGFEKDVSKRVSGFLLFFGCAMFVFCGVMTWILFPTQIKSVFHHAQGDTVRITVHNKKQLAQIQKVHGARNTRAVIYEADKAYFYNQNGEKVILQ